MPLVQHAAVRALPVSIVIVVVAVFWQKVVESTIANFEDNHDQRNGFFLGVAFAVIAFLAAKLGVRFLLRRFMTIDDDGQEKGLYNLDHAILNVEIRSMWMNMGYWKHTKSFPAACTALLDEVLEDAGLLPRSSAEQEADALPPERPINILDLGYGCGDQTVQLTETLRDYLRLQRYVGITLSASQAEFARRQLRASKIRQQSRGSRWGFIDQEWLFTADAAKPDSWNEALQSTIDEEIKSSKLDNDEDVEPWVLALDTLYHFKPSRQPLFDYSTRNLSASIMAFDLLLSDSTTLLQRLILRLVCLISSAPYSNFMTKDEYINSLIAAGYTPECIQIRDVSENVFSGITNYIQTRERELKKFGMSVGGFKAAAWVFGWWAESRVVRGAIVIARQPR